MLPEASENLFSNSKLQYGTNEYQNSLNLFWPVSTYSRHVVDCVFGCVCMWVTVHYLRRVWLSWRWEGCVVAVAAWSSSTGNASKRWELTGTRCLRLLAGGFSLWNKSVSGGSSLPLTVLLSSLSACISESFVFGLFPPFSLSKLPDLSVVWG